MLVKVATAPGREDRPNEDFAAVSASAVVLVDGDGVPPGSPSGCRHGPEWYARTMATALLGAISRGGAGSLADGLRATITGMRGLHAGTCDPDGGPSATVAALRRRTEWVEYLVLAGSVLLADVGGAAPAVITDGRRALAGADPAAADHAVTGVLPLRDLNGVALLTDGASRLADRFELLSWPELLATVQDSGPDELIAQTRKAEAGDENARRWPRTRVYDDATVVYVRF